MTARRSVVTGTGAISASGVGSDAFWAAASKGAESLGPVRRFDPTGYPLSVAGEVIGFDPVDVLDPRVAVQTDRFTQFALAAAEMALHDAALDPATLPAFEFGTVTASCAGGVEFGQHEIERLWHDSPSHVGPYQSIAWFYAASTGQISIRHQLKGPCGVLVTDEAGGLDVLAHADQDIARGTTAMLAGGTEAPLSPFSMACQYGHGLLTRSQTYQPFGARADGFAPGEGGGMLVIEDEQAALRRGAQPQAVLAGHGSTFTGAQRYDELGARGLAKAIELALARAGANPGDIDVVFADALGVPAADQTEVAALREVFGSKCPPVTAPKAGFGRAYAGAAALDAILAVKSLRHGVIPPTPYVDGTPYDIDLVVREPRTVPVHCALVLARGLTGGNSALVLRRYHDTGRTG